MDNNFDRIFDECIDRINRGEGLEACLTDYPEYAGQLEPLLQAALQMKEAYSFAPSTDAKRAARQRFNAALEELERQREARQPLFAWLLGWSRVWATAAAVLVIALIGYFGLGPVLFPAGPFPGPESAPVPTPESPPPTPSPIPEPGVPTPTPGPIPIPPIPAIATGTLEVYVTDAPTDKISNIWVTFQEIAVHSANQTADDDEDEGEEGGWIPIKFADNQTFDLLELGASHLEALLAADNLTAGKYTQLRVIIGEVIVTVDSANITAVLPSGKLKFVRPFEVFADDTTTIVMDFDAKKSVVSTGSGKYIVKPVVQLSVQQPENAHQLTWVYGAISAVDTEARSISIFPTGGTAVTLDVNPQKTEIILNNDEASLNDLAAAAAVHTVNATASYYLNNLKAVSINATSPQGG